MNESPLLPLGAVSIAGLIALSLRSAVDDVLRLVGLAAVIGQVVAYRRYQRRPDLDPFPILARWMLVGLGIGLLLALVGALT